MRQVRQMQPAQPLVLFGPCWIQLLQLIDCNVLGVRWRGLSLDGERPSLRLTGVTFRIADLDAPVVPIWLKRLDKLQLRGWAVMPPALVVLRLSQPHLVGQASAPAGGSKPSRLHRIPFLHAIRRPGQDGPREWLDLLPHREVPSGRRTS